MHINLVRSNALRIFGYRRALCVYPDIHCRRAHAIESREWITAYRSGLLDSESAPKVMISNSISCGLVVCTVC